jgi:hypothetical protein
MQRWYAASGMWHIHIKYKSKLGCLALRFL